MIDHWSDDRKKTVLAFIGLVVGATVLGLLLYANPPEDPRVTKAINECIDKTKDLEPIELIFAFNNNPEALCRKTITEIWEPLLLLEKQLAARRK
jgi:hypothetical protein